MPIRSYQTGDEHAQSEIYNAVAGSLPGFKPSTAAEIARRYQGADPDPESRYFAVENGEVVGYAVFGPNGRISYPWCLPGAEAYREPLLETVLAEMRNRGIAEAWAAYRGDWSPVLDFLREHDFIEKRTMINYVAELSLLPAPRAPSLKPADRAFEAGGPSSTDRARSQLVRGSSTSRCSSDSTGVIPSTVSRRACSH